MGIWHQLQRSAHYGSAAYSLRRLKQVERSSYSEGQVPRHGNIHKDVVPLALLGKLPIPGAPAVTAGGEIGASWWKQNASGVFRHACDKKGSYSYKPLYHLKEIGVLGRNGKGHTPDTLWVDSITPWNPLDDDGEEVEMEDTIFD
ncbi:hypothetical protein K439DRAFT_334710 [Ramaria rubella]|nr:hypothetical protein K439DRAFT_334710 [Ramaria rubella]